MIKKTKNMKKNPLLEQLRRETTEEVKREVDLSFEIADRIFEILTKTDVKFLI